MAFRLDCKGRQMGASDHRIWDGSSGRGQGAVERSTLKTVIGVLDWMATAVCGAALVILGVYASDREPPFRVLAASKPAGVPGQQIAFHAEVWRDRGRKCSAVRSASAYHSGGVRYDYPDKYFSAEQIAHQEKANPGRMAPSFTVPENATPGQAAYVLITLRYECNQAHRWFKPIEVQNAFPFEVLPS